MCYVLYKNNFSIPLYAVLINHRLIIIKKSKSFNYNYGNEPFNRHLWSWCSSYPTCTIGAIGSSVMWKWKHLFISIKLQIDHREVTQKPWPRTFSDDYMHRFQSCSRSHNLFTNILSLTSTLLSLIFWLLCDTYTHSF